MADKLLTSVVVTPEFVDGEQPPAAKFTAIGAQLKKAVRDIEAAIGDIHDESWPYSALNGARLSAQWGRNFVTGNPAVGAVERPLSIANLARLVGPAANLNPRQLGGGSTITDTVPIGVHNFNLRYPRPEGGVSFEDGTVFANAVGNVGLLVAPGDYFVDDPTGQVWTVSATAGQHVTYNIDPSHMGGGMNYTGSTFNVIPDPAQVQTGAYAVTITGPVSGKYTVTLPLVSAQQSNISGSSATLLDYDTNIDLQLLLPERLTDVYLPGEAIPAGFLYLRNNTTNEFYDRAVYQYLTDSTFYISSVDLTDALADSDKFSIVTIGCDITTSIDDLRRKQHHDHSGVFGEPMVPISSVSELTAQPGATGAWVPSENASNFAPQYLHRDGWQSGIDNNINDFNAMRGHLAIGDDGATAGAALGLVGNSYKVAFGPPQDATTPFIRREFGSSRWDLRLFARSANGDPTKGRVTTGAIFEAAGGIATSTTGSVFKFFKKSGSFALDDDGDYADGLVVLTGLAPENQTIWAYVVQLASTAVPTTWVHENSDNALAVIYRSELDATAAQDYRINFKNDGIADTVSYRILVVYSEVSGV